MTTCMVCGKEIECGTGEDDPIAGFYCSLDCKTAHEPRLDALFGFFVGAYGEHMVVEAMKEMENERG